MDVQSSGKLPPDSLERNILQYCGANRPEVLVGAAVGEDAAVIEWPENKYLVVSSDPIVGAGASAGKLLVHVNVNDIASKGGDPAYFTVTLILPHTQSEADAAKIMKQIHIECKKYGIAVVGGHTEFSPLYEHPVLSGTMIGTADRVLSIEQITVGDEILLMHHVGIEGMAILATDKEELLSEHFTTSEIEEIQSWSDKTCVLETSRVIRNHVKFMHDPTEGGVMGGLGEIAKLRGMGMRIEKEKIPLHPYTEKLAQKLGFDPLHLIASGSLIAVAANENIPSILAECEKKSIPCAQIGEITGHFVGNDLSSKEELWRLLNL